MLLKLLWVPIHFFVLSPKSFSTFVVDSFLCCREIISKTTPLHLLQRPPLRNNSFVVSYQSIVWPESFFFPSFSPTQNFGLREIIGASVHTFTRIIWYISELSCAKLLILNFIFQERLWGQFWKNFLLFTVYQII